MKLSERLFLDGVPIEKVPEEERKKFAHEAAEKLGKVLSEQFKEETDDGFPLS